MSVIAITIIESSIQTMPGIPDTIALTTNEPATVFYTLDGSAPDTFSPIYVAPIIMPQSKLKVSLNIFATNGIDNSAVITKEYNIDVSKVITATDSRVPHSAVSNLGNSSDNNSEYPFGRNAPSPDFQYLGASNAGTTIYNESLPAEATGYNQNMIPDGYSNSPVDPFSIIYSTANFENVITPGVGSLPAKTKIIGKSTPVEFTQGYSSTSDKMFNPKAFVVYQDSSTEDPSNPAIINRDHFNLEPAEITRDGALLFNNSLDTPTTSGNFIRSAYNERTNELTNYFYDANVNRWIISKTPYMPNHNMSNLGHMVYPRNQGVGMVFLWIQNLYRTLI
jgi:hypothetical protein